MSDPKPPSFVTALLHRALGGNEAADEITGDLHEEFASLNARRGPTVARAWYVAHAIRLASRGMTVRRRECRAVLPLLPSPHRGDPVMRSVASDFRQAIRSMIKRPGLSAIVILTLSLGLGANATIFETIDALVLRPFTLPDVDRLVMLGETAPDEGSGVQESVSPANYLDWTKEIKTLERLAAFQWANVNLAGKDDAERVQGFFVSASFFPILGVEPALGRNFTTEEETRGQHRRALISDGLWRRRFGADPRILGRTLLLDAEPFDVVGVMPAGFSFPAGADVWAPLSFDDATAANRRARYLSVVGKLRPGETLRSAASEIAVIAARLERQYLEVNRGRGARAVTILAGMRDQGTGAILSMWQASAAFVLLIACVNIANLLLARGAERQRELALRLALGASRGRIVRGLFVESLVLAAAAIPAGIAVAWTGITLIRVNLPARLVRFVYGWQDMDVDFRLLGFTAILAAATAVIFGLLPAFQASRPQLGETLKEGGRGSTTGPGRQRLRRILVTAEIALALPLLVASGLAAIGTQRFLYGSQGYDSAGVLTMRAVLPDATYADPQARRRFVEEAMSRVLQLPGVQAAAVANVIPSGGNNASRAIEIEGQPITDPANPPTADYRVVTPTFLNTMRTPLIRGRGFTEADDAAALPVVLLSEAAAAKHFPGVDPVGRRIRFGSGPWHTIVGVTGDVIQDWFDRRNYPTLYRPYAQAPSSNVAFAIRATGDPASLGRAAAAAIRTVDPAQPVYEVMTMKQVLAQKTIGLQYMSAIMAVFGGLALVLAVLGVYSLMAFFVTQRTHEIGVRIALGASRGDVLRLATGQAARMTVVGVLAGLVLSFALGRLMEAGLLGIVSSDARISLGFAAVLMVSGLAAAYLPARRATVIDPIIALRAD